MELLDPTMEESEVKVANIRSNGKDGKEIRVKPHGKYPSWIVYFYPGGELPLSLTGEFTSEAAAKYAIQCYLRDRGVL